MTIPEAGLTWPSVRFIRGAVPDHDQAKVLAEQIRDHYAEMDKLLDLDRILSDLGIKQLHRQLFRKASELLPIPECADGPFQLLIDPETPEGYLESLEDTEADDPAARQARASQRVLAITVLRRFCRALQLGHTFFYSWEPSGTSKTSEDHACGPTRYLPTPGALRQLRIAKEGEFCRYFAFWLLLPDYQSLDGPSFELDCLKRLRDFDALD